MAIVRCTDTAESRHAVAVEDLGTPSPVGQWRNPAVQQSPQNEWDPGLTVSGFKGSRIGAGSCGFCVISENDGGIALDPGGPGGLGRGEAPGQGREELFVLDARTMVG